MSRHAAVAVLALLAAAGVPGSPGRAAAPDEPKSDARQEATPAPSRKPAGPLLIPEEEKTRKNPVPSAPEALESGKILFQSQCAMCHGKTGDGRGDLALEIKIRVPDITSPQLQKRRTDGEWLYIISHGHKDMPPEKRLVDQQKWEMILYMRTLVKGTPK
jgi:mono/diheme cytochrome c family protein